MPDPGSGWWLAAGQSYGSLAPAFQRLLKELLHEPGIGLAAGGAHDLAHEKAQHGLFACQVLGDGAVLHAKIRAEVMAKLTPAQVQKLSAFRRDIDHSVDTALEAAGQ